ncbi:MAG: TIM44-like domain-containing protein [Bacteroidota bacterium]
MKISWTSLKISFAGAKLSHLVQKNKIWDHGSMIEQVKTVFFKLKKVKQSGNIEGLKKYITDHCYEKLEQELDELEKDGKTWVVKNLLIKELSIIEVNAAKSQKPDCFTAVIKTIGIEFIEDKANTTGLINYSDKVKIFSEQWSFLRQGDWWMLDKIKSR